MPLVDLNAKEPADAPKPLSRREYVALAEQDYAGLLKNSPSDEAAFQAFFEKHPSFLSVEKRRHASWPHMIVTQPELRGYTAKRPDFFAIEENSGRLRAVLIEIETPASRWATDGGVQHHALTYALDQLEDWRVWFEDSSNRQAFRKHFFLDTRENFELGYMLIHGSRNEATLHQEFAKKRKHLDTSDRTAMSFDRLFPDENQLHFVTVRRISEMDQSKAKFELAGIPACFKFDPLTPELCLNVRLNEQVVRSAPFMTQERADFIIAEWPRQAAKAQTGRVLGTPRRFPWP